MVEIGRKLMPVIEANSENFDVVYCAKLHEVEMAIYYHFEQSILLKIFPVRGEEGSEKDSQILNEVLILFTAFVVGTPYIGIRRNDVVQLLHKHGEHLSEDFSVLISDLELTDFGKAL